MGSISLALGLCAAEVVEVEAPNAPASKQRKRMPTAAQRFSLAGGLLLSSSSLSQDAQHSGDKTMEDRCVCSQVVIAKLRPSLASTETITVNL